MRNFRRIGLLLFFLVAIPGRGGTADFTEVRDAVALWNRVFGRLPALEQFIQEGRSLQGSALGTLEANLKALSVQEASNPFLPLARGVLTTFTKGSGFQVEAAKASALAGDRVAVRWLLYQTFLRLGEGEAADHEFRQIREIRDRLGLDRIAYLGWNLTHLAEELAGRGDTEGADAALALAEEFDPHAPGVFFARARILLRRASPGALISLIKGWWVSLTSPFYGPSRWADILASLLLAVPLGLLLVGLVLIVRVTPLFQHDLAEWTRRRLSPPIRGLLPIALYLLPVICGLGLLPAVMLSLVPMGIYLKVRERLLWGALVLSLLLLPGGYRLLARVITANTSPRFVALLHVEEGDRGTGAEATLRRWVKEAPRDLLPRFYLGRLRRMRGELAQGIERYSEAQALAPQEAAIWTNRGNLAFLAGDLAQAQAAYEKAIALDPALPYPRFTLSQLLTERLLFEEAQQEYAQAVRKIPTLGERMHQAAAEGRNQVIVDAPLPDTQLWRQILFVDAPSPEASEILWAGRFVGASLRILAWLVGAYVLAFGGTLWLRKRRRFARACEECGKVFCPRCQRVLGELRLCTRCAIIEKARAGGLPPGIKSVPPEEVQREPRWLGFALLLIPGLEGIYRGRTLRGFLVLTVALVVASPLLGKLLAPSTYLPRESLPFHMTTSILLLFCLYVFTAVTHTGGGQPKERRWR